MVSKIVKPEDWELGLCFLRSSFFFLVLAGGNQRKIAHQKNMKKTQEISQGKSKEHSLTTSQRKQSDSEIMQQNLKAANEKKSMQTMEK
ncbi:PREDICTED: small EDRK-rich factor 1-like [Chrysochloris asiatica]|uniref:Small EDRK-rich factor 1-like n=1 Tax=Chrysochloris asiatica TaxID=185453 RepID=A0A9B0T943_CHRAS|nr:PREDICTED: small EDRK-rich factor 1-like [Chrysochloris asiatica]